MQHFGCVAWVGVAVVANNVLHRNKTLPPDRLPEYRSTVFQIPPALEPLTCVLSTILNRSSQTQACIPATLSLNAVRQRGATSRCTALRIASRLRAGASSVTTQL